jgi:hypothetical protein
MRNRVLNIMSQLIPDASGGSRMKSKVYFMDDRYKALSSSIPAKAMQLFDHAGIGECFKPGESKSRKISIN